MNLKTLSAFIACLPFVALCSPPDTGFEIDLAHPERKFEYTTFAGNTPSIPVSILTNGNPYNGFSSYSPQLNYGVSDAAASLKTISGTLSGNVATFQALTNSFPTKGEFFCEVYMSLGSQKITCGQGVLRVNRSPSSGSYGDLDLTKRINWDIVTNIGTPPWYAGAEPAFLASVAYGITAAATTRWESAYSNITLQRNTNAQFQAHISSNDVFMLTTQPNTNAALLLMITNNFTAQRNTNTTFQSLLSAQVLTNAAFQALFTNQSNTNILLASQITNNLDNQKNTNALFQSLLTAQSSTNSAVEAFRVAQVNTNSGFESRVQTLETGSVTLVVFNANVSAQANTNAAFQSSLNAQVATNAQFQAHIASNDIFALTTQPATNTALQTQITNNLASQAATNLAFQAVVQGWSSVSNTVITNAANGQTAFGWGNHAAAGYLGATQTIYSALTIGNRSQLSTNLSGLATGWTGTVGVVSHTGECSLAAYRVYAWGFQKNAYGTATVTCGEASLSSTISVSNFFHTTAIRTNVVLTLSWDGAGVPVISNLYVKQLTNGGDVAAAGDVYVGGTLRGGNIQEQDAIFTNWLATNTYVQSNSGEWAGTWQGLDTNAFIHGMTLSGGSENVVVTNNGILGVTVKTNYTSVSAHSNLLFLNGDTNYLHVTESQLTTATNLVLLSDGTNTHVRSISTTNVCVDLVDQGVGIPFGTNTLFRWVTGTNQLPALQVYSEAAWSNLLEVIP